MSETGEDTLTAEQLGAVLKGQDGSDAPTVRDTLEQAYDRIEAGGEDPDNKQTDDAPDQDTDGEAAPDKKPDQAEAGEPSEQAISDGEPATAEAPTSWSDAEKAEFAKLPPDVQKTVARRESDRDKAFEAKTREIAEARKGFEDLDAVVQHFRPYHAAMGLTPADAVQRLFTVEHALQTSAPARKRELFLELAKSYGIDLTTAEPADDGLDPDPAIHSLETRVSGLSNQVNEVASSLKTAQDAQLRTAIESWSQTKNQDGSLKFPHFPTVMGEMGKLMSSGQADSLDAAYEKAVWQNPELRETLIAGERERAAAEVSEKAAADKAKRAARANVSNDAAGRGGRGKPGSIRETMEQVYDEATG